MPLSTHTITSDDVMSYDAYKAIRADKRQELLGKKKNRRIDVGPWATFYFECYETMWYQVQEMLYIEKGGAEQLVDELEAYNPLIPQGQELVATVMFEIDDPDRRSVALAKLGGVEETMTLTIGEHVIKATWEKDVDRTTADGKTSAVHFIHFPFTAQAIDAFRQPDAQIILGIGHEDYAHMTVLQPAVRQELASDFK